jgi:hypothetical protein
MTIPERTWVFGPSPRARPLRLGPWSESGEGKTRSLRCRKKRAGRASQTGGRGRWRAPPAVGSVHSSSPSWCWARSFPY